MKKIAIYTTFWGEQYSEMFYKYLLPSVMQKGNLPRLETEGYDIQWHIYTPQPQIVYNPFFVYHQSDETITVPTLKHFMNENIDAICFMLYPDIFVGNHSMYNGVKMVEDKPKMNLCVAHPRVSLQKLNGKSISAKTNAELVNFAFQYSHKCLWGANSEEDTNLTWAGISWKKIDDHNYAVVHNLASPFVFQFTPSDIHCICVTHGGCMDRDFVCKLQGESRVKLCGSSDLCFFVEITSDNHNQPMYSGYLHNDRPDHGEENSTYWKDTIVNWRGA